MKSILMSKRFNPGHISHLEATAELLKQEGFDVKFSVHQKFFSFSVSMKKTCEASFREFFSLRKGDLFVILFPSFYALLILFITRFFCKFTSVYIYHEPYTSFSSYRDSGFGLLKSFRIAAISIVNRSICLLSNKIILPSERAFNSVPKAKYFPMRFAKINLMFADETDTNKVAVSRNYVSYIGTIAEDHAFDEYVRLMRCTIIEGSLPSLNFLIATRSQIPARHRLTILDCVRSGRLSLQCGKPMTTGHINSYYEQSLVVWNAYKRSMQSGVLPKAYMFGTPVLISTSNQSEFFQDGVHGALISDNCTFQEFQDAIYRIQSNWPSFSQNCRSYYLNNFDFRSLSDLFMKFISK